MSMYICIYIHKSFHFQLRSISFFPLISSQLCGQGEEGVENFVTNMYSQEKQIPMLAISKKSLILDI